MAQAVRREPWVGFDQGCPIRVAIEVLPERMTASFEVRGINDSSG